MKCINFALKKLDHSTGQFTTRIEQHVANMLHVVLGQYYWHIQERERGTFVIVYIKKFMRSRYKKNRFASLGPRV